MRQFNVKSVIHNLGIEVRLGDARQEEFARLLDTAITRGNSSLQHQHECFNERHCRWQSFSVRAVAKFPEQLCQICSWRGGRHPCLRRPPDP